MRTTLRYWYYKVNIAFYRQASAATECFPPLCVSIHSQLSINNQLSIISFRLWTLMTANLRPSLPGWSSAINSCLSSKDLILWRRKRRPIFSDIDLGLIAICWSLFIGLTHSSPAPFHSRAHTHTDLHLKAHDWLPRPLGSIHAQWCYVRELPPSSLHPPWPLPPPHLTPPPATGLSLAQPYVSGRRREGELRGGAIVCSHRWSTKKSMKQKKCRGGGEGWRGRSLPAELIRLRSILIIQACVPVCRPLKRTFPRDETRRGALLKGLWQEGRGGGNGREPEGGGGQWAHRPITRQQRCNYLFIFISFKDVRRMKNTLR